MVKKAYKELMGLRNPGSPYTLTPALPPAQGQLGIKFPKNESSETTDSFFNYHIDVAMDECNIVVTVAVSPFAYIKVPSTTFIYRKPECTPKSPPVLPLPNDFDDLNFANCGGMSIGIGFCYEILGYENKDLPTGGYAEVPIYRGISFKQYISAYRKANPDFDNLDDFQAVGVNGGNGGTYRSKNFEAYGTVNPRSFSISSNPYPRYAIDVYTVNLFSTIDNPNQIKQELKELTVWKNANLQLIKIINSPQNKDACDLTKYIPTKKPPIQPPPPPPMTCNCCPNVQQNDELLRLILKRIGTPQSVTIFDEDMDRTGDQKGTKTPQTLFEGSKLNVERTEITNRLIGIENYPIKAPRTIIEDYKTIFPTDVVSLFEFAYENPEIELKSLTEFLNWQVEQESATMGQWYQLISYETKDKDGNPKTERVELVNVAETLKEIIILLAGMNRNLTFLDDLLIRNINETIGAKTNAIRAMHIAEDIQDYLDYPTNEKSVSFPVSINLPDTNVPLVENEDVTKFLKMSVGKITYQDWTGKQSLHDLLLDLLQAASVVRGAMSESGEELGHYFQFEDGGLLDE